MRVSGRDALADFGARPPGTVASAREPAEREPS